MFYSYYKHQDLIETLLGEIDTMCGVGTRCVKLFLNKKIKEGDFTASVLRSLLEIETYNINAKKYYWTYRIENYEHKYEELNRLVKLLHDSGNKDFIVGIQESDVPPMNHIVYFENPMFGQISFHCDISKENQKFVHEYKNNWDNITDSTLFKLETCINRLYGNDIRKKYPKQATNYSIHKMKTRLEIGELYIMHSNIRCRNYEYLLNAKNVSENPFIYASPKEKKLFNDWLIAYLTQRDVKFSKTSVDDMFNDIYAYLSQNDELKHIAEFLQNVGFELYVNDVTESDIKKFESMFQTNKTGRKTFVSSFDSLSTDDINKLKLCLRFMSSGGRKRYRHEYTQYLVNKYHITIKEDDINEMLKSKKNKIRKEAKKLKNARINQAVDNFINEHKDLNICRL